MKDLGRDPARCLGACFVSPASGVAIIALALIVVFNGAAALYVPAYLHYVDGCVAPPRAGTFFSRNLFSLSYNYAAAEGNQQLLHSLDHSNLARTANCSVEARHTTEEQRRMQRDVDAAEAAYRASLAEVRLMRRCLRIDEVDRRAEAAVQPYVPLRAVLADDACVGASAEWTGAAALQDGVFSCSAVPPCASACDRPSRDVTATLCQRCGCRTEWYAHGIAPALLALLVFASLNTSRAVVVDAVPYLWKQLFAGSFEFIANCDDCSAERGRGRAARSAARQCATTSPLVGCSAPPALHVPWLCI